MKNKTNMFLKGMLGRFSATVMLFAVGCIAAFADNNKLYIDDFTIAPGQTKNLEVILDNESPISSLEFIVKLPDGLSYVENSLAKVTSRVTRSSHTIGVADNRDKGIKIVMLSTSSTIENSPVKGNSGAILTIDVKAANNYKGGVVEITDIIGSDATNKEGDEYVPRRIDMDEVTVNADVHVGDAIADAKDITVRPDVLTKVGVSLDNIIDIVGLQAVITLPEGVSFVEDEDGEVITYSNRLSGNTVATVSELEGEPNKYTLLISSLTSDVFDGATGNLFALNVAASKVLEGDIVISDIKVSSVNGVSYTLDNTLTTTIKCVTDPTGDGKWTIDDIYAVINASNSDETDPVCDLNGDGVININDLYQAILKSQE